MTITEYLKFKNIKTSEFAKIVGCSQPAISLLANGLRRPSPGVARQIEIATDGAVSRDELLFPELYNNIPDNTQPQQKQG